MSNDSLAPVGPRAPIAAAPPAPQASAAAAQPREAALRAPAQKPLERAEPAQDAKTLQKNLQEAVERLNDQMKQNGRDLAFSVDNKSDKIVVTVKNTQTGEVVRQIPSETALRVAHNLEDVKGMLLDGTS